MSVVPKITACLDCTKSRREHKKKRADKRNEKSPTAAAGHGGVEILFSAGLGQCVTMWCELDLLRGGLPEQEGEGEGEKEDKEDKGKKTTKQRRNAGGRGG